MDKLSRLPVTIAYIILALAYLPSIALIPVPYSAFVKALPLILLIAALVHARKECDDKKQYNFVLLALVFSILGDTAGDIKSSGVEGAFIAQIGFFAIAQLVYTASFNRFFNTRIQPRIHKIVGSTFRALIMFYLCFFGPIIVSSVMGTPMYLPVGIYMVLITSMAMTASLQSRNGYMYFLAGATLFVISDSSIAYDTFVGGVPFRGQIVMWTYYGAQLMLSYPLIKKS